MASLFGTPTIPRPPAIDDPRIEAEKRRALAIRMSTEGRQATIITGGAGVTTPLLGAAASLQGGTL